MAGCDGWVTIKVFELIFSVFCIIFKRVTDDEANKLFYFLQKVSREWPLLNNVTWEENGAIFTDVTYGGYVIITAALIIGQCTGELNYCKRMENFFLVLGALLFISAGSLELAALDSVEERLVDNAAILGVISLLTGLLFILDLLLASKRRKRSRIVIVKKVGYDKDTQTEGTKVSEIRRSSDMNGNVHKNGQLNGGFYTPEPFPKMGSKKIPKNGVKILPTSPTMDDSYRIPVTNSNNEYVGTIASPIFAPSELKSHEAKVRSTESFLRSEKGEMPQVRKMSNEDRSNGQVFLPPGYVLVPAEQFDLKSQTKGEQGSDGSTPPGYAKIMVDTKTKKPPGYVMIPMDQVEPLREGKRKLQSPTVTTTVKTPQGYYYNNVRRDASNLSLSDPGSDLDEPYTSKKPAKYSPEYLQMDPKVRKHSPMSDDSADLSKLAVPEPPIFRPDSRHSYRSEGKSWGFTPKGKINRGYSEDKDEVDFVSSPFQRNSFHRSSRSTPPEKPKSILRLDQYRSSKKENGLNFPKDVHYDSLDSQKIAEDLRHLKEITKSDIDLTRDLEKENQMLKEHLRKEKEERERLQKDFKDKEEEARSKLEAEERKKLEERVAELEDLRRQLKLEKNIRDFEERKKLEDKIRELEDEKDRRMSEREVQYFGISDLRQSHKDSSPVAHPKITDIEEYFKKSTEGAKEVNAKLKEKFIEQEDKAKDDPELRKILEEGFYFLDEEERKRRLAAKPKLTEKHSAPDLTSIYQKSIESYRKPKISEKPEDLTRRWKTPSPEDSDETPYSQITDEEGRGETPGSASYKSEAQFWLGGDGELQTKPSSTPASPADPGFVLHTVQNWPESKSPSPHDRFHFSSKKAQKFAVGSPPKTPSPERGKTSPAEFVDYDEQRKTSQKSQLLDFEETPEPSEKVQGRRKGLLVRKVDFPEEPVTEIRRPETVSGSTSTWKKWLQPSKPKLQSTRSTPN